MSKTRLNQIAPGELIETFGVDGVRYHFLRDTPFGPDGDFSYEGMIVRYNADLANQLGNLLQRVSTVVRHEVRRHRPGAARRLAAGPDRGRGLRAMSSTAWRDTQPSVALEATWRIIRATNDYLQTNEPWKMEPGPAVDAVMGDALEALRIVAILASPAMPTACDVIWRRIGLPGSVARPATARRRAVGWLSGCAAGRGGRAAVPAAQGLSRAWRGSTTTATCAPTTRT